jgi:hypothetical protein
VALDRQDDMNAPALTPARAAALVARLELDLDDGICHACLSFVSFAIDRGDERAVTRWVRRMTPDLWDDGLDVQALAAVRKARDAGMADSEQALAGELADRAARDPWLNPELNRAPPPDGAAWN